VEHLAPLFFMLLSDVVNAANTDIFGCAANYLDGACTAVHIEIIVREHNICTALDFNTSCIVFSGNGDFVAVYDSAELGVSETEVLGSAEQNAAATNNAAVLVNKTVRIVAVISVVVREILLGQPYGTQRGAINIKAAAFDDGCIGTAQ